MGFLKLVAVLGVFSLAGVACLFVFDVIPRETLQEVSTRIVAASAIVAAAGLVVALLIRKPGP